MEGFAFLPLPQGLRITEVCQAETDLLVQVISERVSACCPLCGYSSDTVHSRYQRQLMEQVKASSFRKVKRFATGLRRDNEEVLAGLTEIYSNGQVEGFVNKLKLIKRMGYGRAGFPLLRQRVLHAL